MSSRKHISVEIGIQKADHKSVIQNTIANQLSDLAKEIGVEIDYNYYNLEEKVWNMKGEAFDLIDGVSDVICITELYVPKNLRRNRYAKKILNIITNAMGIYGLVFAKASVVKKEYPDLKYTIDEEEAKKTGKKIIPITSILETAERLFTTNYFFDCTDIVSNEKNTKVFLFNSPVGNLAEQFMEVALVTYGRMPAKLCNGIYTEAIYNVSRFEEQDNVHLFPVCTQVEGYDFKTVETGELSEETINEIGSLEWYSGNASPDSNVSLIASINRENLTKIGGHEVAVESFGYFITDTPSVYIEVENGTVHMCTGEGDDIPETYYYSSEDNSVIRMFGYVLLANGVWAERVWYYDMEDGTIYDFAKEEGLAYVGTFVGTPAAEDEDTKKNLIDSRMKEIADIKAAEETPEVVDAEEVDDDEDEEEE